MQRCGPTVARAQATDAAHRAPDACCCLVRVYVQGKLGPLPLEIVDTGGLEMATHPDSIEARMQRLTAAAVEHAEVVMFMVDATQGITAEDRHFAACVAWRGVELGCCHWMR